MTKKYKIRIPKNIIDQDNALSACEWWIGYALLGLSLRLKRNNKNLVYDYDIKDEHWVITTISDADIRTEMKEIIPKLKERIKDEAKKND